MVHLELQMPTASDHKRLAANKAASAQRDAATSELNETTAIKINEAQSGVGLSNSQLNQGRRRTLDLVNKLHSTGYASFMVMASGFHSQLKSYL